jgi:hypothetical protein
MLKSTSTAGSYARTAVSTLRGTYGVAARDRLVSPPAYSMIRAMRLNLRDLGSPVADVIGMIFTDSAVRVRAST